MNGDVDSGRKYLEFALKEIPNDIQILCDLAVLETHQGNGGKAKEYILKAWEIDQNHPLVQEVFKAVVTFDKAKSRLTKKAN